MDRLKDLWSGQDLINRIVLISGLAVFLWCLVKGQGLYGLVLLVVMMLFRPQGALGWQSTLPYKLTKRTRDALTQRGINPTDIESAGVATSGEKGAQA